MSNTARKLFLPIALVAVALIGMSARLAVARQAHEPAAAPHAVGTSESATLAPGAHANGTAADDEANMQGAAKWVLIIFVVFAVLVLYVWFKMIAPGLVARRKSIEAALADARKQLEDARAALRQQNAQLDNAESRINEMLAKATRDGEQLASNIRTAAQREATEAGERAQRDITASKDAAIREVYSETATLATNIAEKILRRNLNADDQRALVQQSLDQLQNVKV